VALDGTQDSQVGPASCQPAAARSASVVPITVLMVLVLVVLPARRPSCSGPTSPPRCGSSSPTAASPGRLLAWAQTFLCTTIEGVRKSADQRGLAVIPRRWVVERSLGWLAAHRRLTRDYERDPAVSEP
jgi:hypothetical protein